MAPRIAEHPDVLLPVLVCQDGFTITHSAEPVTLLPDEVVRRFVGDYSIPHAVLDVARYDIFGLSEAMLSGNAARFARTLEGLREEGEAPPLLLWSLTEEIRALLKVKLGQSQGKPMAQLLRDARVWGPRQGLIERGVKRLTQSALETALLQAAECDRIIKGVRRGDLWDALRSLGMRIVAPNV